MSKKKIAQGDERAKAPDDLLPVIRTTHGGRGWSIIIGLGPCPPPELTVIDGGLSKKGDTGEC